MKNDVFTFIVGGKAGEGVKKAGSVAARLFVGMGRQIFEMDDYQSLIKGGHNFSVISTAKRRDHQPLHESGFGGGARQKKL